MLTKNLGDLWTWLENTSLSQTIGSSTWLFPALETTHVLAIATVVGTIMMVDLRLLDLSSKIRSVTVLADELVPWTWIAFVIAAITGFGMFMSRATAYAVIWAFQLKFCLIALAGLNMLVFHFFIYSKAAQWDRTLPPPMPARVAGGLSLLLWVSVVFMGRLAGFLML